MKELRVDIVGTTRGFQQATDEAVGIAKSAAAQMEERQKKADMQATDSYVSFWQNAIQKREASDMQAHEKRMAQMQKELESYTLTQQEMKNGSGGYGWRTDETAMRAKGGGGGRMAGMMAGQAAMGLASGAGLKEVTHGALMISGSMGIEEFVKHLIEGKVEGLRRLPNEIMHVVKGFKAWGAWIARGTLVLAAIAGVYEIIKAGLIYHGIGTAKASEKKYGAAQNTELDKDGERLRGIIDEREKSGALSSKQAETLRSQLATHAGILSVMKQMVALQSDAFVKEQQAAAHRATLAQLAVHERNEVESEVNAKTRMIMLMQDEAALKREIKAAESAHDEGAYYSKYIELLHKQHEIFETGKELQKEASKGQKTDHAISHQSQHVDSSSSMGLFQSVSAATNNPLLEVNQRMERHLAKISTNTGKHATDIHAP